MPNAPKTPTRTFRCDHERWSALKERTTDEGITATDVLIRAIDAYLEDAETLAD